MAQILLDSLAFSHNINEIKNKIIKKPNNLNQLTNESLALVIKDNAYGHGLKQIAILAEQNNIKHAFVKNYNEAKQVYLKFKSVCVLYNGVKDLLDSNEKPESNINLAISSMEQLISAPQYLNIELKVNVGMNRNGISLNELDSALNLIKQKNINLKGVFSHNGYGDNDNINFFKSILIWSEVKIKVARFCELNKLNLPRFHAFSTSGAIRFYGNNELESSQLNEQEKLQINTAPKDSLIRIGIGAYGYHTAQIPLNLNLKPVASLWADRISRLELKKGESIGYGGVSVSVGGIYSTYDVGYGDGLFRLANNKTPLLCAEGEKILAIMSMDCISIKSDKPRICIFNDVRHFAKVFNTIPYVILSHLNPFIQRKII